MSVTPGASLSCRIISHTVILRGHIWALPCSYKRFCRRIGLCCGFLGMSTDLLFMTSFAWMTHGIAQALSHTLSQTSTSTPGWLGMEATATHRKRPRARIGRGSWRHGINVFIKRSRMMTIRISRPWATMATSRSWLGWVEMIRKFVTEVLEISWISSFQNVHVFLPPQAKVLRKIQ